MTDNILQLIKEKNYIYAEKGIESQLTKKLDTMLESKKVEILEIFNLRMQDNRIPDEKYTFNFKKYLKKNNKPPFYIVIAGPSNDKYLIADEVNDRNYEKIQKKYTRIRSRKAVWLISKRKNRKLKVKDVIDWETLMKSEPFELRADTRLMDILWALAWV